MNKEKARHGVRRAGRWLVQLRFTTHITSTQYVKSQAWHDASLLRCPLHPNGDCGFARHGTYARVHPPGTRIARWYCRQGHQTFSALPDCLASHLSGDLAELEDLVKHVEQSASLEAAARTRRIEIELPGALRYLRRRVGAVHRALVIIKGLYPQSFVDVAATVIDFQRALGVDALLMTLRVMCAEHLPSLPTPLGFNPTGCVEYKHNPTHQHHVGPDPPINPA